MWGTLGSFANYTMNNEDIEMRKKGAILRLIGEGLQSTLWNTRQNPSYPANFKRKKYTLS
jgi:hypothetical protein